MTARYIAADYPAGRLLLRSGTVDVGAVFPPQGLPRDHLPWTWRLWLNGSTVHTDGRAKTELAGPTATGIEVYPPDAEIVDQADMFHLWIVSDLPFSLHDDRHKGIAE